VWDQRVLRARRLPARRPARVPHVRDHRSRRRSARQRLDVPRPHAARPPRGVGGHPTRPPPDSPYRWWRLHDEYGPSAVEGGC
jgi:hypothetical protein